MASSILYKFRSGATFEALPLPGTAARLFDVKKAIVVAKKLDQGSIEFDLSVRDATTNVEYTDETMLLPRGARLVVHRLPAARGHGILAKISRSQMGMAHTPSAAVPSSAAPSNFYTIDTRANDEEDEFVSTKTVEEKELEALRAATDASQRTATTGVRPNFRPGGGGGAPRGGAAAAAPPRHQRPNADPELRELQQKEQQPKKRATGIPRTFLSLSAPPKTTDAEGNESSNVPLLQPNTIGFEELKNRGGGQSENASGSKRDLEYALKLTATTIPDYLLCAISGDVATDAMILPWDPEGRTVRESVIRDALTQNGFRCPLTGQEGVSPDDLLPNHAVRKAAEQFIKKTMQQMEEIEKQQVEEDKPAAFEGASGSTTTRSTNLLEGDSADKGVILSKRASVAEKRKKQEEEDPFGGDDDFGGDVFAVEAKEEEEAPPKPETEPVVPTPAEAKATETEAINTSTTPGDADPQGSSAQASTAENGVSKGSDPTPPPAVEADSAPRSKSPVPPLARSPGEQAAPSRRDRRRGPPAGYTMGPAGGAVGGPRDTGGDNRNNNNNSGNHRYNRDNWGGRGRRGGGRYGNHNNNRDWHDRSNNRYHDDSSNRRDEFQDHDGRPSKRQRSESVDHSTDDAHHSSSDQHYSSSSNQQHHDRDYGGGGRGNYRHRGRGGGGYHHQQQLQQQQSYQPHHYRGGGGGHYGGRGGRHRDDYGGGRYGGRGRGGYRGGRGRY